MFNAEEIIELEKKWLKYKIKQKSKVYLLFILFIGIISALIYQYYLPKQLVRTHIKIHKEKVLIKKESKKEIKKVKVKEYTPIKPIIKKKTTTKNEYPISHNIVVKQEDNKTLILKDDNGTTSDKPIQKISLKQKAQNKPIKSYYFKLIPTEQGNELFSSDGFLNFNSPIKVIKEPIIKENQVIPSIREAAKVYALPKETMQIKKKPTIEIDMKEVDTITYLKQKFYSTSSIVFALMLSEEYYNEKKYKNSLKWSLIANDIDSQNTKTWYWFAKSKVKLNKKEDAIRALKAYLSNNKSKRLRTLLKKIELGDIND